MGHPPLSPDEAALWARVMAQVRPIAGRKSAPAITAAPPKPLVPIVAATARDTGHQSLKRGDPPGPISRLRSKRTEAVVQPTPSGPPSNTLDGTWDRQLSRGLVSPDRTIDLHGHSLHSAYDLLDAALDNAIRQGDRVILLVTGKPPRSTQPGPAGERPHARGAIRAATGDWLAGSRHGAAIAAVRPAHPRHGGAGALYIVLRRARANPAIPRKS